MIESKAGRDLRMPSSLSFSCKARLVIRSISHKLFPDKYVSNLFLKPSKDRTDLRVSLDNLSCGLAVLFLLNFFPIE